MSVKPSFIGKGTEFINDAIQKDNPNEYKEAFPLYCNGIQYLLTGMKYEKNEKIIQAIKQKLKKYIKRAEELKEMMNQNHYIPNKSISKHITKKGNDSMSQLMQNRISQRGIDLVYGYSRENEKLLIKQNIPNEIINLFITYYHILPYKIISNPKVKWNDVIGLESAKMLLKESVILPLKFPQLFTGKRAPFPRILLYGPSGCGKSYLIEATAKESESILIIVYCKDLISVQYDHYYDTDTFIKDIYNFAKQRKQSIICFDELQHLRNPSNDKIRRIIIKEMSSRNNVNVQTIGIIQEPWNLDLAIKRRMSRRIYIKLPNKDNRNTLFRIYIQGSGIKNNLNDKDYNLLSEKTNGFNCYQIYFIVNNILNNENKNNMFNLKHILKMIENIKQCINKECIKRYDSWTNEFGQQ